MLGGRIIKTKKYELKGLSDTEKLDRYNAWFWDEVKDYAKDNILEVGSGIGRVSKFIVRDFKHVVLSDYSDKYIKILRKKYKVVIKLDLTKGTRQKFDCIISCNVLEHIEDDKQAINNLYKMLRPGGILILQLPACPFLFNEVDKSIYHYRRYTVNSLRNKLKQFKIIKTHYFNFAGIPGWWFAGSVLKRKTIPEGGLNWFNRLLPIIRFIDKAFFQDRIGVNVIAVCQKSNKR